ncbi:regulatory proteasome non-atpase subunit 9 [Phaeodactylum tricornutum CCAP 1055/1]|uniref:Regulatory proteasome non-atpase subunit 9 n=1 Tax=Phaeodactylum tricornutum (strain CCAP 1055/1) TaxID=556484 RepID=B7FXG8_PHATC|nr:regulatory proteasome non-atpase subunit 9 [Phaeodactylum tricornutum CCAP 1055/1]EEC49378.1 regulatory proteasome non-atpase subunit 9 [Phaeodactylum tricornutum CCAP 1055/1]|eukprot:XP_002179555.1 regulatory proteasome non-atpase subunit 9 [Phaeodactylum tricornutum CCAP 1055/1]
MSSSSYVDPTAGAVEHCELMANEHPELATQYQAMASFCQQKLWHELTLAVLDLVADPTTARSVASLGGTHSYLALYNQVVTSVHAKLNPLSLAQIASAVARVLHAQDGTAAKAILENLVTKLQQDALPHTVQADAVVYAESKLSLLTLEAASKQKAALQVVDNAIVSAAYYEALWTYYKILGPPEQFYAAAMQFLNYAPPPPLDNATTNVAAVVARNVVDYQTLAVDLCLAALTGDGVYNLGQLEASPVLAYLQSQPDAWLVQMLHAVSAGDLEAFASLTSQHATSIQKQPALVHRANAVQEKLLLLALVRLVFTKDAHDRTLTLNELAVGLGNIPVDQVEWVVMRALSVHLVEGHLDQVDGTVTITWVRPRALNTSQMTELGGRLEAWAHKAQVARTAMQEQVPGTFA